MLAATCSSIGKSEPTKAASAEPEQDNTNQQPGKISSEETRSSFKPYKQTAEKGVEEMNEKAGFRAPSKENTAHSPVSSVKDERTKIPPVFQYPPSEVVDTRCGHAQNRMCGVFPDAGQQVPHSSPSLHNDCSGGCIHPASLLPFKGGIQPYPSPALPGQDPTGFKTHGMTTALPASMYAQCGCGFCTPHGESAPQSALAMSNLAARPLQLHGPGTPYIDYLHRTICRDVNCTNCIKPQVSVLPYGYQAAPQQCGPHCTQCENMKNEQGTPAAAYSCYYPHNLAMFKNSQDEGQPFVCNWVAGSKHCGKSFVTSEDLFQHLRTHTQVGNAAVSSPSLVQPACNVHGCPCKLRASPVQSSYHSARYRPYYFKPTSFPPPPTGCYTASPYQLHGVAAAYDTHRLFK